MNKKFLVAIIGFVMTIAARTQAEEIVFVPQNASHSHPEVLVHIPPAAQDNVIIQDTVFTETSESDAALQNPFEANAFDDVKNKNISYYVQKLNLTPEQIIKAQEISNASHAKQEQLLKNIEDLRAQAHELENSSLSDFVAILTDEQKIEFNKLQYEQDVAVSQPEPQPEETQPEAQPEEAQSEPQSEETQPESQLEEVQSEPQPEETQPESQPEEVQSEPQSEETQPESQE